MTYSNTDKVFFMGEYWCRQHEPYDVLRDRNALLHDGTTVCMYVGGAVLVSNCFYNEQGKRKQV